MATPAQSPPPKEELLAKLKRPVDEWNLWRTQNSGLRLRLDNLDLSHDLNGIDLHETSLAFSKLRWLQKANLAGAYLVGADMHGVSAPNANFSGADLRGADLRESDLKDSDLSQIKCGLLAGQLAGADLTGTKLPEPTAKLYEKLGSVSEISDSAKKLFLALLAGCLYSWLTIATTKDVELITNRASSPLPIIQTAIPIVGFYVVAPIILLCIYFYFHFYLQKLWEELATLPAVFPDGRPLYARADPWLFNDLVRAHFVRLKKDRPFLSHFQQWISIVLAWWIVPITLLLFWGRYLPRHDTPWTIVLAVLLAISIVSAIQLYRLARETLGGCQRTAFAWKKTLKRGRTYWEISRALITTGATILITMGAIFGTPEYQSSKVFQSPRMWISSMMERIGYSPFANLQDANVSVKPSDWTGTKDEELRRVTGASLNSTNLRFALASGAFLAKAQLEDSDLSGAELKSADLRQCDLENADLTKAVLWDSFLQESDLQSARLDHAELVNSNLSGADLSHAFMANVLLVTANLNGADLSGANLHAAQLESATLSSVKFSGADLSDADLERATLKYADFREAKGLMKRAIISAKDWQMAFFDSEMLKQLGLPPDNNEVVEAYRDSQSQEPFDSWAKKWREEQKKAAKKK